MADERLHIYLSSNFWDGLWIIQQPIANEIGKTEPVLYVERFVSVFTILRYPRLWSRLFTWLRGVRVGSGRVHLLAPLPLFHLGHRFPRLFNLELWIQSWWIKRHARKYEKGERLLWIDNPVFERAVDYIDADLVIYHVADEMSAFDTSHAAIVQALEDKLLARTDVVFSAAEQLSRDKRRIARRVHTVWNAIDTEVFAAEDLDASILNGIPAPRVAFVGVVDSWVDVDLLADVATTLADVSFMIVGPVVVNVDRLRVLPNVHFTGRRPRQEIPTLLRLSAASLIPFRRSALTERIVPLKVFEALAAGIVPVTTDFSPDLGDLAAAGRLKLATTAFDFAEAIRDAVREDTSSRRTMLRHYGAQQNWSSRWRDMDLVLRELSGTAPNDAQGTPDASRTAARPAADESASGLAKGGALR